jgi:hypothetical protein
MDSVYLCRSRKDAYKMNQNIYEGVKAMYMSGASQDETMKRFRLTGWAYTGIINKVVLQFRKDSMTDRVEQARTMERNIFAKIKKKEDVSGLVKQFSSFCA